MKKKNKENKEIDKTLEVRVMKTIKRVKTTKLAIAFLALILLIVAPTTVEAKTKSYMKFESYEGIMTFDNGGTKLVMYEGESIRKVAPSKVRLYNGKVTNFVGSSSWENYKLTYSKKGIVTCTTSNTTHYNTITAKKAGTVTIKFKRYNYGGNYKDYGHEGTLKVIVKKAPKKSITMAKKSITLVNGKESKLSIKSVKGLSGKEVTYKSSNKRVATVDKNGVVTAVGSGKASITVTSKTNKKVKTTVKVKVISRGTVNTAYTKKGKKSIEVNKSEVEIGVYERWACFAERKNGQYNFVGKDSKGELALMPGDCTSDAGIALNLRNILKKAEKEGRFQIKVTKLTGVASKEVVYKSSNPKIATVTRDGRIEGKMVGTTVVTVSSKSDPNVKATIVVKVADWKAWLDGICFIGTHFGDGDNKESVAEIAELDADLCCYQTLNWVVTSSDENIVKVDKCPGGLGLMCLKPGKARITVQSKDGHSFKYSWDLEVTSDFGDAINPGDIGDENNFRVE